MASNELAPRKPNSDLTLLTVPQLLAELAKCLAVNAETVYRMACIWTELEKKGHDLSEHRGVALQRWFYPIAIGKLLPEAVIAFMHKNFAVDALIGVPLALQDKIINGYKIKVYAPGQGKPDLMTLDEMPKHLVEIIFKNGKIMGPDKQKAALNARPHKKVSTVKRLSRTRVTVNKAKRTVMVGTSNADVNAVVNALADAGGFAQEVIETKERRACVIATKVTDEEKERLEALAKGNNTTVDAMVRKAVIAMYLL